MTSSHSFIRSLRDSSFRSFWSGVVPFGSLVCLGTLLLGCFCVAVACLDGPIGFPFVQNYRHSTMICHDLCHHPCHHHHHPDEHCFSWPSFLSPSSVFHFQVFLHSFGPFDWLDDTRTPTRTPLIFTTPIHFFRNSDFHSNLKDDDD